MRFVVILQNTNSVKFVCICFRILAFNRAPFVVGRKVDFWSEIMPVADHFIHDAVSKNGIFPGH